MKIIDFDERESLKVDGRSSKEKAIAFSFEEIEVLYNRLLKRDPYNNKVLVEMLDDFLEKKIDELNSTKDNFLQIVDYTLSSLEKIASNPKKQLLKISELQDINKVPSADFKTMMWLGSKPGKTLVEKIGVKGKVLAPKNVYSVDKKENRLVNYYFKKIYEVVEKRKKYLQDSDRKLSGDFNEISKRLYKIKRMMINNEIYYLKRPLDFEPNNTLIDHRDYSIVNRGLKQLNEYIEKSKITEKDILDRAMELSFYQFVSKISSLNSIKIINSDLNPEDIKYKLKENFEFYLDGKKIYNVRCFLNKEKSIIAFQLNEVEILRNSKIKIKDKSESAQHFLFKFNLFDKNKDSDYLKIEVKGRGFGKKYRLDKEGLLDIPLDLFGYILSKISILELKIEEKKITQNTELKYINFNSQIPILNDELLSLNTFSEKYNSFFEVEEYYNLENYRDLYDINTLVSSGDKVNLLTKYLKLLKEKEKIKENDICIYSAIENLDVDIQKDILSVFKSNIKESYPIWRSIFAIYAKDFEKNCIKENTQVVIIDCNILTPSFNIVEKKRGEYEHHPALDYEIEGVSLKDFLKKYIEDYLTDKNLKKLSSNEIENLVSSGKVYKALFFGEKYIILSGGNNFYLERDNKILKKLKDEFKNRLTEELRKFRKTVGKGYTNFILITDYLDSSLKINGIKINNISESELSLGKDEILERLDKKKSIWNEFLPNLSLETLKPKSEKYKDKYHFYNLDLIKNKSINLTLGKEEIFDVDEKLELPAGNKTKKYPLHSEDSFNKKVYFLEITNESDTQDIPISFNLKIGYSYGSKDPYRVILIPMDKKLDSKLFTTKWLEKIDDFKIKKIKFPEICTDLNEKSSIEIIDGILDCIKYRKKDLKSYLSKNKNKLRKFIAKEVNNGNYSYIIDNLFAREGINKLFEILELDSGNEELKKEIKKFISAFGSLILLKTSLNKNELLDYRKRSATFLYKFTNLKIQDIFKNELEYISFIAEVAWLDSNFINELLEKECGILERCIKVLKQNLERMNRDFDKMYRSYNENGKIWQLANNFRDSLEFLLAVLMIQDKIKLNKKNIYEILYTIKSIDRKIQLDKDEYPGILEKFNKSVRVKFEIESKGELDGMSDLAYSLYNYMTGDNGSDSIKIKEVEEVDEEV